MLNYQTIQQIAAQSGNNFYLFDKARFEQNYDRFLDVLRQYHPNTQIGYSYKTNYLPIICQTVQEKGGYAEVVSGMEYQLALKLGVPSNRIIFNGPVKTKEEIFYALENHSIVNLDSDYEIDFIEEFARSQRMKHFAVGIRCNFDIGVNVTSRFGFDAENGAVKRAVDRLSQIEGCRIAGLHCHFATSARSLASYETRTIKLAQLANELFSGTPLDFLDVGGGYFSNMSDKLRKKFSCKVPTLEEYGDIIGKTFKEHYPHPETELIVEPGTALVADAIYFACEVLQIKQIRERPLAIVVGSIHNVRPKGNTDKLIFDVIRTQENTADDYCENLDITGYTCMEHDCLVSGYEGHLAEGDYLLFHNIGAYTIVFKPPFIQLPPPVVQYDFATGDFEEVHRRETADDIMSSYYVKVHF